MASNPRITFMGRRLKNGKLSSSKVRVSFVARGKRAKRKTRTVYPEKGKPRFLDAAALAKMRANGRKQFKKNRLARFHFKPGHKPRRRSRR